MYASGHTHARAVVERSIFITWLWTSAVTISCLLLSLECLLFSAIFSLPANPPVELILAAALSPLSLVIKWAGLKYLHFKEHQDTFDGAFSTPDTAIWPPDPIAQELRELANHIDAAEGIWDKHAARTLARSRIRELQARNPDRAKDLEQAIENLIKQPAQSK